MKGNKNSFVRTKNTRPKKIDIGNAGSAFLKIASNRRVKNSP